MKSHHYRFFHRNLTNYSTINKLACISRCKKCNRYNNIPEKEKEKEKTICTIHFCLFCGNPIRL